MVNEREEIMEREESLTTDGISEAHMIAIQNVAAAMHMELDEFLTDEVQGVSPDQARGFMKAFVKEADDHKILTAYYLIRATTEPPR